MKKRAGGERKIFNWKILIFCFIIVFIVSFIGSLFTSNAVGSSWYQQIKPSITPPNWIFPIAWTVIFILIAFSMYFAWASGKRKKDIAVGFAINLILNIVWSFFYFSLKKVNLAFVEIIFLWLSILYLVILTWRIDRKSSYLLLPYLFWVVFAAVLNYLSI